MNMNLIRVSTIIFFMICYCFSTQGQQAHSHSLYKIFEKLENHQKENKSLFPDVSELAQKKEQKFLSSILSDLKSINIEALSVHDRINFEVFKYDVQNKHDVIEHQMYLIPFNAEGGFYNRMSYSIKNSFNSIESAKKYNEKLKAYPAYFRNNIQLMKMGMERGFLAPKIIASNYQILIEPFVETGLEENIFFKPYRQLTSGVDEIEFNALRTEAAHFIQNSLIPLYRDFNQFMQDSYLPACPEEVGISKVPGGLSLYQQRIKYFTSLDMTPDEVFERGQSEVKRIRAEMEEIIKQVGFEGDFNAFLNFLRTDSQFYARTPRELLMHASFISKRIDGLLPQYFNKLPRQPYGVQPVPEAIAPNYTGGRYSGGSFADHEAGNYWVNTYKLESRPLYVLPSLTLHEAVPGHHLQIALSQELENLPKFRNHTYISAFGEGWALYTEWLGNEMGIYETPYEQFGRLTYEMWRACRLVVDVGMHAKGWGRQKAFEFLSSNTALSLHECNTEINRYIGWPGQAVSYKIGELTIRDLRKKCEAALGDNFDLRKFHDKVLENGSIPLYVLTSVVDEFILDEKQQSSKQEP